MTKGNWHDTEKPGHKYTKRERGSDGKYRYWYPEEHEREDKPATAKRKHEEPDYRPPSMRYSDEVSLGKLMQLGDSLSEAQDGITKDDTGFNNSDVKSWGFVSAHARADDPAAMHRIRVLLAKYKRQITGGTAAGLDEFYKLGLQDAILQKEAHGNLQMFSRWFPNGDLVLAPSGYLGDKFNAWREINRQFGVEYRKTPQGQPLNYIRAINFDKFDLTGYAAKLAELDIHLVDIPDRPALPPPAEAPPQGAEATVQPESAGNSMTTDDVIDDIINKQAYNTIAVKVLTQGEKAGNLAIWSTFSKDFKDIMGNKSGDPRAITGIVEVQKDMGWARITNDPRLAEEALAKLRQHLPNFTFVIDKNVDEWKAAHEAKTSERQKPIAEVQDKINPEIKPFKFQNEAVRFFMDNDGNGLLGDEMGLGKTLEALAYAAATNKRAIVICPRVVRKNWLLEAKRFFPGHFDDVKELVSKDLKAGGMPDLSKVKIATINYEILGKFLPAIKAAGFDLLIVDESHRIKNPKAQLTQNVQKIGVGIPHKILLSGTALKNKREELFTQLELVRPGFVTLGELKRGMIGALHHKLDKVYLARKKKDVVADMPPKLKQAIQLDVPGLPQTRMQQLKEEGWDPAFDEMGEDEKGNALGEITRIKHETAKAKAPVTADFVKELLESSDSNVLVFTDSVPAAEAIKEKLGPVAVLHIGGLSAEAEDAARAHFDPLRRKEGDHVRVLVSTTAKGIGFNAQTADKVVFNDLPWTPADKDQAEDRAYRIGTKNAVNVYDIHAAGSSFDKVTAQLLLKKAILYHKLLDGVKMSAAETAWANTALSPAEVLAAMRGKEVGPKVAEVDAPPVKTSTGMTVISPKPEADITEHLKAEGHKVYDQGQVGQALQDSYDEHKAPPKSEYRIRAEREEAERKAKTDAEEARRQDHYRAAVAITSPFAAQHIADVDPKVRPYFEKLHEMEATQGSKGAHMEIPRKDGSALARWFDAQRRAKNPRVSAGQVGTNHHFYSSPAGDLHLWQGWHGTESSWSLDYTTLGNGTLDALPLDRQAVLDELTAKFKEPEHNERPKFVIPATKPIEDTKPAGGATSSAHAHAGGDVHPPEDKLESRVGASGQPQQLALFKALQDEHFVLSGSGFDLCMSLADRLVDAGEFEDAIDLIKAAGHKYIRRIPTGKVRPRWYYVYNVTSKHHDSEVQVGEKVRVHSDGQAGHYEVEQVHANGYVTVKHDESGQRLSLKAAHLHEMFAEEHQPAIQAAHQRLQRTAEAAKVHGSEKQRSMAKEALRQHEERFQIKTPERIATQKAQGLTMLAKVAPSVENHQAAADAHEYAAGFDTEHTALHKEMAKLHRENARLRSNVKKSVDALKADGVTFHTPGKTEAEKAAAPVLALPTKVVGAKGPPKAKGAFFGTKRDAYRALVTDEFSGDYSAANKRYWDWKDGRGPKPEPYTGGELDAINQALSLEVTRHGFKVEDPRVTSLAEGWDRLVGQSKRWDSDKVMAAIKVLRQVPGLARMEIPEAAQVAQEARMAAEMEADQREAQGGDYEEARLDDAVEKFSDDDLSFDPEKLEADIESVGEADTSFDFGFNVKPEHADPRESYKELGPKAPTFKAWFGDWEDDPAEASKVIKKDGTPAEQHNMAPMPVYHGSAVGGFTAFDPDRISNYNIFGDGFYFTEDKEIATEYTQKDNDEHKWGAMNGLIGEDGKPVTHLPAKWAQKVITSTSGYGGELTDYADWDKQCLAAALKRAMEPAGVNVTTLLREYRNPSGPVLDSKGDADKYAHHGSPIGLRTLVKRLAKDKVGTFQPDVPPPQVFEVFLNVRKPIDMDAEITPEEFRDLAGYMQERQKPEYRPRHLHDTKSGPEKWESHDRIPLYTKELSDLSGIANLGDDRYDKELTYAEFLKAKQHMIFAEPKEDGTPQYGIVHLSSPDKLTWGDVHYIMTDAHNYQTEKKGFLAWAQQRGYDGITHTGGWNVGTKNHKVWITFKPNQIKATQNEGTFDPTTPDIRKSMNYQPNTFVILPDKLEKAWGTERPGHKYLSRRAKPGGGWEYEYADEKPAFHLQVPAAGALGPITSEDVPKRIEELKRMPREMVEALDKRVDNYVKKLGTSAPAGLHLWQQAIKGALSQKPKMVAKVPAKPTQLGLDFAAHPKPVPETTVETKPAAPAPPPPKVEAKPATTPAPKERTGRKELAVDVGIHVKGTRWEKAQALTITDLDDMTPEDQVRAVTKKNLMPTWEPQELLDQGMDPEAVLLRHAMEKCIIEKPENNGRARRYYLEGMDFFAKSMTLCKTKQDIMDFIEDWHHMIKGKRRVKTLSPEEVGQAYDDYLVSQGKTLRMPYPERKKALEEIEQLSDSKYGKGWKYDSPEWKAVDEKVRALKADFDARGGNDYRFMPLNQVLARALKLDERLDVSYKDNGFLTVFDRDPNLEAKVNDNNTYARMAAGFGKTFVGIVGHESPKHHGPKVFRDALGVATRWGSDKLSPEEKIKALHDRLGAKRTAAKPREAPFKWERDVPGEIDRKGGKPVGDITPQELAKDFGFKNVQFGHWVTDKDAYSHLKGAYGAFSDLADILGVDVKRVSMNGRLSIGFGARGGGKFAAHYEPGNNIINITKIAGGGCLAHEWAHAMDNLLAVSHDPASTVAQRMVSDGATEGIPQRVKDAYADVMAAIRSQNPEAQKKLTEANALIKRLNAERRRATPEENKQINEAQRAAAGNKHSEFYQDAASFSKASDNYWTRGHEMFARAFESFIEDTLEEEGRKSSYLVAGTQVKYPTGRFWTQKDGTKRECQMYPQGEERKRINAAIRRLIEAMGEEKSLEKALEWLERQPLQRFTIRADMAL